MRNSLWAKPAITIEGVDFLHLRLYNYTLVISTESRHCMPIVFALLLAEQGKSISHVDRTWPYLISSISDAREGFVEGLISRGTFLAEGSK